MSTYEYMMGIGSDGDMVELGPGVSIPPDAPPPGVETAPPPVDDMDGFIAKLKNEQGPFVFIDDKTPEGKKFVSWITLYEPSFFDWFMKLMMVKMAAAGAAISDGASQIPEWVTGQTIRIRKSLWDTYQQCTIRIQDLLAKQGKVLSSTLNPTEAQSFLEWWKTHDPAGVISLIVMFTPDTVPEPDKMPEMQFPKKLYDFWKVTKGSVEPPKPLLGMENSWSDWFFDNWLWLAGGAAGGVLAARWYMGRNKEDGRRTVVEPISRNPRRGTGSLSRNIKKNMREGWGRTLHLTTGDYELHPILPEAYVDSMRAMNMKEANKFRVVSGGENIGELHKSQGKHEWRALSYYGGEKYGNSRAQLLGWLRTESLLGVHTNPTKQIFENQTIRLPNSKTVELIEHSSGIWRVVSSDNQSLGWLYMETEEDGFSPSCFSFC